MVMGVNRWLFSEPLHCPAPFKWWLSLVSGAGRWSLVKLCTALHCTALRCAALHCTALHCTALHYTALHCTAFHCTVQSALEVYRLGRMDLSPSLASHTRHTAMKLLVSLTLLTLQVLSLAYNLRHLCKSCRELYTFF